MNSSKMGQWFKSGTAVPASEFLEKFEGLGRGEDSTFFFFSLSFFFLSFFFLFQS